MPEQTQTGRLCYTQLPAEQGIQDFLDILKLGREGVMPEELGQRKITGVIDSTPAQVETYGGQSRLGESFGEWRKHAPVLEALEAVDNHDGRTGSRSASGSDIHQDGTQSALE
jgi:hypothetical protein